MSSSLTPTNIGTQILIYIGDGNLAKLGPTLIVNEDIEYITCS